MKSLRHKQAIADLLISSERLVGIARSDEERFLEAGFKDRNEYWSIALSDELPVSHFVHLLNSYIFSPSLKGVDNHARELNYALFQAYESEEQWFLPSLNDDSSLQRAIFGELREGLDRGKDIWAPKTLGREIKLRPREAAEWLLARPKKAHLVPPGLKDFLQAGPPSTGLPGRPPKSKDVIEVEARRRRDQGEALLSVKEEGKYLAEWFGKSASPHLVRPTAKTIENNIRLEHRQWNSAKPRK